jgi:nitroimidazol reductase NimA-like FMN-containing flavoprotein (pyridoxamine 5'-phosphate oxidase superfamily)
VLPPEEQAGQNSSMPRMNRAEVNDFLAEPGHHVRIATVDPGGHPLLVPAWFLCRHGRIYVTPRARSQWFTNLRRDPRTCFSIDEEPLPYRKVTVRGRVEILHPPGEDDLWRDIYRAIALRYWPSAPTDAYLDRTRSIRRALVVLSFDYDSPATTTWRLPRPGEDEAGIWASRYWES